LNVGVLSNLLTKDSGRTLILLGSKGIAHMLNDPVKLQSLIRQIPLGRLGEPADVAGLAVFLSSRNSDDITGTTYLIDGRLTVFYQEQ